MSGWKGHIAGATVLTGTYVVGLQSVAPGIINDTEGLLNHQQLLAGLLVIGILFGLWPDVDTNSKGQNIFFGIAFVADILLILGGRYEAAAYLGLLAMTPIVGKHRGWTHSKLAMLLVPLPIVVVPYYYHPAALHVSVLIYGAAVVGYFSHLLLDGLIWRHFRISGG